MKGGIPVTCNELNVKFDDYIDDTLSPEEKTEFENHIKQCPECQEELNTYKLMLSQLHDLEDEPLPQGFHQELMQNIKALDAQEEKTTVLDSIRLLMNKILTPRVMAPTMALACLCVIVLIGQQNTKGDADFYSTDTAQPEMVAESKMESKSLQKQSIASEEAKTEFSEDLTKDRSKISGAYGIESNLAMSSQVLTVNLKSLREQGHNADDAVATNSLVQVLKDVEGDVITLTFDEQYTVEEIDQYMNELSPYLDFSGNEEAEMEEVTLSKNQEGHPIIVVK